MLFLGLLISSLAIGSAAAPPRLAAQAPDAGQVINVFMPAPRPLRQLLSRAERALAEDRPGEAVDALGQLLSGTDLDEQEYGDITQDYFLGIGGEEGTRTSLKVAAQNMLGSMSPKGRELYELRFGGQARALLQEALRTGSEQKLTEVTRRFFHTEAGYEATLLLGRQHLDMGRPLAAALSFKRLTETPARDRFEPELSLLLATSWAYAQMPDAAEKVLTQLKARQPNASFELGGQRVQLFSEDANALTWLSQSLVIGDLTDRAESDQWVMFRGNATRNARSSGSMPLINFRWRVPTANDPDDEELLKTNRKSLLDAAKPVMPGIFPLVVDDVILTRSPRQLVAVDIESGKRVWVFPWDESQDEIALAGSQTGPNKGDESPRTLELSERVWQDAVYGQISSDGDSVFVIDELSYTNSQRGPNVVGPGGIRQRNPGWPKAHNRLVSLNLPREGALEWRVGGQNGGDEPRLAQTFFLGAPLPMQGELYVLAEVQGEVRLVVLDAETGQLQWQQKIAHLDSRTITRDGQRRLAGATPSFADGVLICPTSAGAVVAIDVSTRSLLWGFQYGIRDAGSNQQFGWQPTAQQVELTAEHWLDSTATIVNGKVLLTPIESDYLHCLDLLTGKAEWEPRKRDELLYIGCVHDNRIVLVGKNRVTARNLSDGTDAWSEDISLDGEMPSGRGFHSDEFYYVPTTNSQLLKINIETGKLASRIRTGTELGNLTCYGDQVVSQGYDWLTIFYQSKPLEQEVTQRLEKDPEDAWALARRGELHLQEDRRSEAIVDLKKAHDLTPDDDGIRVLLVRTLLQSLQEDFAAYQDHLPLLEKLIEQPEQHVQYLRLVARGKQNNHQYAEAFEMIVQLADSAPSTVGLEGSRSPMEDVDRHLQVRRDRWMQAQLTTLLSQADAEQRQRMNAIIEGRFAQVDGSQDTNGLRTFFRTFGMHPSADQARLQLARLLIDSGEWIEAEYLLTYLEEKTAETTTSLAGPVTAELARLLTEAGRFDQAADYYARLQSDFAEVKCRERKTGQQLFEQARDQEALAKALGRPRQFSAGRVEVESGAERINRYPSYQRIYPVDLRQIRGPIPRGTHLSLDQRRNSIIIRDGFGGELQTVSLNSGPRFYSTNYSLTHAKSYGHFLFLAVGYEMLAVDALRGVENPRDAVIWRTNLAQALPGQRRSIQQVRSRRVANPWGELRYVPTDSDGKRIGITGPVNHLGVFFQRLREVTCVDPLTGETIWVRNNIEQGSDVFGDDELIFVVEPGQDGETDRAMVLRAIDGSVVDYRNIPKEDVRWSTQGRNVLAWEQAGSKLRLRIVDAWTNQELWSSEFSDQAKGTLVADDEVAVLDSDGRFVVVSLRDGVVRVEDQLEPEASLVNIHVMRSSEQYLLATNRPNQAVSGVNYTPAPGGYHTPLINGNVYCFDRSNGKALWPSPARIERYGLPLDQPPELPILLLMTNKTETRSNRTRGTTTSILALDRRDGRVAFETDDVTGQTTTYEVEAKPAEQEVEIRLSSKSFVLKFTEQAVPPEPPAQTGSASSRVRKVPNARVRSLASALGKAFESVAPPLPNLPQAQFGNPFGPVPLGQELEIELEDIEQLEDVAE